MTVQITSPFPIFTGRDGLPLQGGYIYVSAAGTNPIPTTDRLDLFWDKDLTITCPQPVRTINGYPSRSGSPARIYAAESSFSIRVNDKSGALVYSDLNYSNITGAITYDNVNDAIADTGLVAGDIVTTLGYYAGGDGGGAQYEVVNASPGTLGYVNHLMDNGLWLELKHNGYVNIRQAGAKGDGVLDVAVTTGTDDTDAIQAVLDLVITGDIREVYCPKGIYNFTTLLFYDPAITTTNLRGGFVFKGAGRDKPTRLKAQTALGGTTFKGISATSCFDINKTATGTNADSGYSMSCIYMCDFNVIGASTAKLVRAEKINVSSEIARISIYNGANGVAFWCKSLFTTWVHNIQAIGDDVGTGFYYETDWATGGMVNFENITMEGFSNNWYLGHTTLDAGITYAGLQGSKFKCCQGTGAAAYNLKVGKLSSDITAAGNGTLELFFDDCFFEIAGTANINLTYCASMTMNGGSLKGNAGTNQIVVSSEYTDTGTTAPVTSSEGGYINLNNVYCSINSGGTFLIELPDNSWYRINTNGLIGRIFYSGGTGLIKVNDTTAFFGSIRIDNHMIVGQVWDAPLIKDNAGNSAMHYLHPASNVGGYKPYVIAGGGTLDFTNRPYLPATLYCNDTATIYLPNPANFFNDTGVTIDLGVSCKIVTFAIGGGGGAKDISIEFNGGAITEAQIIFNNYFTDDTNMLLSTNDQVTVTTNPASPTTSGYNITRVTPILFTSMDKIYYVCETALAVISD